MKLDLALLPGTLSDRDFLMVKHGALVTLRDERAGDAWANRATVFVLPGVELFGQLFLGRGVLGFLGAVVVSAICLIAALRYERQVRELTRHIELNAKAGPWT